MEMIGVLIYLLTYLFIFAVSIYDDRHPRPPRPKKPEPESTDPIVRRQTEWVRQWEER
jgi:hypothetical protein